MIFCLVVIVWITCICILLIRVEKPIQLVGSNCFISFNLRLKRELEVYEMSYFSVFPQNGYYRTFLHPYKLIFQMKTKVKVSQSVEISHHGLNSMCVIINLVSFKWLGVVLIMPPNMFILFDCFWDLAVGAQKRKGYLLIWHAVVWVIWKARNNII